MKNENKKIARLIKQIQRGNQSAFEEFYKLTSTKAYFIALKITQTEHDAEDILQESYIKALENLEEYIFTQGYIIPEYIFAMLPLCRTINTSDVTDKTAVKACFILKRLYLTILLVVAILEI